MKRAKAINPLLFRLFLDHDIIFFFLTTLKKNQEKFKLITFENIMEKPSICSFVANALFSIIFPNT